MTTLYLLLTSQEYQYVTIATRRSHLYDYHAYQLPCLPTLVDVSVADALATRLLWQHGYNLVEVPVNNISTRPYYNITVCRDVPSPVHGIVVLVYREL